MLRKTTLANGIRVVTECMPEAHSVAVGFWVENGSRHEKVSLNGISHFLEHMLFKGTTCRSALEIAREADSFGGVLNAFTSREFSCYYAKVLHTRLSEAVSLLADLLLNSTLDENELEKERRVILQEISLVDDTPEDLVHDLFSEAIWRQHPLGLPVLGRSDSVRSIRRADLRELLRGRYLGQNLIVTAAGQLDHDLLCRRIEASFSDMAEGEARAPGESPLYQTGIQLHEKELEQVHLCLGCKALPQNHEGRFALQVMNTLFGASMSSRLFQRVREERGLAYSIYSYLNCHTDAGALVVYCATSAHQLQQVVELVLGEFGNLRSGRVSDDEVGMACEQLKGNFLLSLESSDSRMSRLARNEIYHGYQPALEFVVEQLEQVDARAVCAIAEEIFASDSLTLQAIGDISGFKLSLHDLHLMGGMA